MCNLMAFRIRAWWQNNRALFAEYGLVEVGLPNRINDAGFVPPAGTKQTFLTIEAGEFNPRHVEQRFKRVRA